MKPICFFTLFVLLCSSSLHGQVKDEPAEKDSTIPKGFFTIGLGQQPSLGYAYGSISYNHLIGHIGGDTYLGLEVGTMYGEDGAYGYRYLPIMLAYTTIIGGQKPTRRFLGYANLKVGTAKFMEAKRLGRKTIFTPPPVEDDLFAFALNGGGQLRLSNHLFLYGEAGLGTVYTFILGITVKI